METSLNCFCIEATLVNGFIYFAKTNLKWQKIRLAVIHSVLIVKTGAYAPYVLAHRNFFVSPDVDPPLRLNTRCFMAKFVYLKSKPDCRAYPDRKCIRHQTSCNVPGPSLCKYIHVHVSILRFTMVGKIISVLEKNAWTQLTSYHKRSDKNHFIYLSVSFAELSFYLVFRMSTCII